MSLLVNDRNLCPSKYFLSSLFVTPDFRHWYSRYKPRVRKTLRCPNTLLTRSGVKSVIRAARLVKSPEFCCLTLNYGGKYDLRTRLLNIFSRLLRERNKKLGGKATSTLKKLLLVLALQKSFEDICETESFIHALQLGQRSKGQRRLSEKRREQLVYFSKALETSRKISSKIAYLLLSFLFLFFSFFLVVRKRHDLLSFQSLDWVSLLFSWKMLFGPILSFVAPILLFMYTFLFPLSFRDTYRRYILSYFVVLFAQGIAWMFAIADLDVVRFVTEMLLYGIYVPTVLWAWKDLGLELGMASILDKRFSFVFTFWRILTTCFCFVTTLSRIILVSFRSVNKSLLLENSSWINSMKTLLGFSTSYWKTFVFVRIGYFLLYCYVLYSLLFFTVFVDCGSEFCSRHDVSPFTRLFFYLGVLDRNLTTKEASKKKEAWRGFFAAADRKLGKMLQSEEQSKDMKKDLHYPLEKQCDVFSYIARFEAPWDKELELREEVLMPFRAYLDNLALAIHARRKAYPKKEEKKLLPACARELEDALLLFSEVVPPNREHYDVERLYDEPESVISQRTDKVEPDESRKI